MLTLARPTWYTDRTRLTEEVSPAAAGAPRVDTTSGIIRGVKVLGLDSRNGRRYDPRAVERAARLYEGAAVRVDHPADPDEQRPVSSNIGWLRGVRFVPGKGLFADLHVLTTHPYAKTLFEAARRNPRLLGLSHNAAGECDRDGRTLLVREITEVRSVDLVSDPATTAGLFESYQPQRGATVPAQPQLFDDPAADVPTQDSPEGAGDGTPEDALRHGFRSAMVGVIDSPADKKTKLSKLRELLTAAERLLDAGEDLPEEEEPVEPADNPDEDADLRADHSEPDGDELTEEDHCGYAAKKKAVPAMESLQRTLAETQRRLSVYRLCEQLGLQPPAVVVEAASRLADPDAQRELLEAYRPAAPAAKAGKPRSGVAGDQPYSFAADIDRITDPKSFADALLRGLS